jgi:hypothetical protein
MAKSKSHEVTIRLRFDAPVTLREARYAAWNHLQDMKLYGDGKPSKDYPYRDAEPYGEGKITVRR